MQKGIDISRHNGTIDFDKLKSEVDFVWIKATSGTGLIDAMSRHNVAEAERVGLPYGLYHYAYPEYNSPEDEADWFATIVGTRGNHPLALDYESDWDGDKVDWCKRFLDRLGTHYEGYKAFIYLNLMTVRTNNWFPVADAGHPLWLAYWDYDANSTQPTELAWRDIYLRQYSNRETVAGVPTLVDGDVFYGDNEFKLSSSEELYVESLGNEFAGVNGGPSFTVLRKVPTDNYEEVDVRGSFGSHFDQGWIGRVIKEQGDWYLVSIGGGMQQGWAKKWYLSLVGSNTPIVTPPNQSFDVATTVDLRERKDATTKSQKMGVLTKGTVVTVTGYKEGESVNGETAWYLLKNGLYINKFYTRRI